MQIHIHLSPDRDADIVEAWDRLATGDRSQAVRDALRTAWCDAPNIAKALDHLARAVERLESNGKSPEAPQTKAKPDKAALKAALLGPFQSKE